MGDPNKARFPNSNLTRATTNNVNRPQMPYVEKPLSLNITRNSCQQSYFNTNAPCSSLPPDVSDLPPFQKDDPFAPAQVYYILKRNSGIIDPICCSVGWRRLLKGKLNGASEMPLVCLTQVRPVT